MDESMAIEPGSLTYPEWQTSLQEALVEFDKEKLKTRIAETKAAISNRLLAISSDVNHHEEKLAIRDALVLLRILEKEDKEDQDELTRPDGAHRPSGPSA